MRLILALDQSTSATKAVLFDSKGKVLDKASRDHRQIYPKPGWVEHDAEEIWQNALAVIQEIVEHNRPKLAKLAALSITNQRETVLVFDRKTGHPLCHALVWLDRRGDPICQKLRQQGFEELVASKTGLRLDAYFSASKLKWLIHEKPELAVKIKEGDAVIGTIDTYLVHRLTGGKVFASDYTNASRTLLFDISKLHWDEELCRLFDVSLKALPEVRESAANFGDTDADGLLPERVPIFGVMGDSQASLFGQRCYQPGMAKATFGTGTSVLLNIGDKLCHPEKGVVATLAWVWQGKPVYAFEGIISFSAATIEWLKSQLGLIQSAAEVEFRASSVEGNGGVYLVPAFAGLSAPYWAPEARAAIVGMTAHTNKSHIVRAAEESVAYQIRDVLDMMRVNTEVKLQNLHADGGPTRDQFLMQFTADLTGAELVVSELAESSAWGASSGGLLGLGICNSLEDLTMLPRAQKLFCPNMKPAEAQRLHQEWLAAVKRVL